MLLLLLLTMFGELPTWLSDVAVAAAVSKQTTLMSYTTC